MALSDLSVAYLSHNPPVSATKSAIAAINLNNNAYPPFAGVYALREAISQLYLDQQHDASAENVLITAGVRQAINLVLECLLHKGAGQRPEVLVPSPYWFAFRPLVENRNATFVAIPTNKDNNYTLTADQLLAHITPHTKVLILTSPNNPTGTVYSNDQMQALVDVLDHYPEIYIITDEIYESLVPTSDIQPARLCGFQSLVGRVITINGFGKAYCMAAYRVGYIYAPSNLISTFLTKLQETVGGVSTASQMAALGALSENNTYIQTLNKLITSHKKKVDAILAEAPKALINYHIPDAGYYFWVDINGCIGLKANTSSTESHTIKNAADLASYLLTNHNIQVYAGTMFGCDRHLRLSFNLTESNLDGFRVFVSALKMFAESSKYIGLQA